MISVPLKPQTSMTAKSLANDIGATVVIRYDANLKKFVGYVPGTPSGDFAIDGGKGYIINVEEAKTIPFIGAPWTNTPSYQSAPARIESAWAFVIDGSISADADGYTITMKNIRTGAVITDKISSSGYFNLANADLSQNSIIQADDKLEIAIKDASGKVISSSIQTIDSDSIKKAHLSVKVGLKNIPSQTMLMQNYPNPFNPETWIPFQLSEDSNVKINIYDMQGKLTRSFSMGKQPAGVYDTHDKAIHWDGRTESGEVVGSGVYFYEFQTGKFSSIKKMIIQK